MCWCKGCSNPGILRGHSLFNLGTTSFMPILLPLVLGGLALSAWKARKQITQKVETVLNANQPPATSQALRTAAPAPHVEMSLAEAEATHQQHIALTSVAIFAGATVFPVLTLAGLPLLAYNYYHLMKSVPADLFKKNRFAVALLDILSLSLTIFMGYFFLTGVLFSALYTAERLIARTEREARIDFNRIFGDLSNTVWLVKEGVEIETELKSLKVNDVISVHTGEMIPVDGYVVSGEGLVDQHLLTGEAQPIEKQSHDYVYTSTLLLSGNLHILVEKQGEASVTGQIAKTLEHAATMKHQAQSRGERLVEQGASRTLLASTLAWPLLGASHAVALSYSGFGYQMRMAAPLMVLNYLRVASQHNILIKDGRALDKLNQIDTLVFDKTGTLTEEVPHVERLLVCNGFSETKLLQYAASAESHQKHPLAQAICRYATQQSIELLAAKHSEYAVGHGLRVELEHGLTQATHTVLIGSQRFMERSHIEIPSDLQTAQQATGEQGYSMVYVAHADSWTAQPQLVGAIELRPTLRPGAHATIRQLHELGIRIYIISGDQEQPTRHLAEDLGIDDYFAETLPEDKADIVKQLQEQGRKVCFIGDGINDSVALQSADVAISLHGAATIAQDAAEIVLMTPELSHLPYLISLAKDLDRRMYRSEVLNVASGVACVSGVLLLGMPLGGAIVLFSGGLLLNLSNAMMPLFMQRQVPDTKDTPERT